MKRRTGLSYIIIIIAVHMIRKMIKDHHSVARAIGSGVLAQARLVGAGSMEWGSRRAGHSPVRPCGGHI
jgi:hypothetical protein